MDDLTFIPSPRLSSGGIGVARFARAHWLALMPLLLQVAACAPEQPPADKTPQPVEYGPDVRTLTVSGTIDPRLYASVRTTYRPTDYDKRDKSCTRSDLNTARRKGMLDWEFERIKPDENNRYEVTVPIDYVRENRCGYEFASTIIRIKRDERDDQYAHITLLSSLQEKLDTYGSHGNNWPDDADVRSRTTTKPHYRLAQGSHIQCHTDYFERSKLVPARVLFNCYPLGGDGNHGVDEIATTKMRADIHINEEIGKYYYGQPIGDVRAKKDHFRDYTPPPGFFERLKQRIEQLLTQEAYG